MRRILVYAAVALAVIAGTPSGAAAATAATLRIREAVLEPDGTTRLVVAVSGASGPIGNGAFAVSEDGVPVDGVETSALNANSRPLVAIITVDVSGSTAGKPLRDAIAGARSFVRTLPQGARAGIVSFGERAKVLVPPTTDRARLSRTLGSLRAGGGTSLYDGVILASRQIPAEALGTIVVFSDGADTESSATQAKAIAAARDAGAQVVAIGLPGKDYDGSTLRALAAGTGGRAIMVSGTAALTESFRGAARDLGTQFVLTYSSTTRRGDVRIAVALGAVTDAVAATRPAAPVTAADRPASQVRPPIASLAGSRGLLVAGAATFLAMLFLLATGSGARRPRASEASRVLSRGLRVYTANATGDPTVKRRKGAAFSAFSTSVVDKLPTPDHYEERLQKRIDRAGWPLRASELLVIQAGAGIAGFIFATAVLSTWWLGPVLAGVGIALPRLLLQRRIGKRQDAFLEQLPDTLQLIAGSLQAGYGFLQAMDTLVRESSPPTSTEFGRVLTEIRLGMPVEDSLSAMADRFGSEDLRWVVLAMNIQRQVGGNLATLLNTVAETLRERERVRRQIKVLSAEGRLSAWILGILPVGIAGYISVVNPGFLEALTSEHIGRVMIGGAVVSLGIGVWWMRKIIRIEV